MAKKKETKKEDVKEPFDWRQALEDLMKPNMFKAGVRYYIQSRNLTIKDEKEFTKIVDEYGKITLGG